MYPKQTDDSYIVVRNTDEQYSIWRAGRPVPSGWLDAGEHGTKDECLRFIRKNWSDIRPVSVRNRLEIASRAQDNGRSPA